MIDANLDWIDVTLRLALAAGLGALLGLEREYDGQDAGFRTHVLLVLGSALFGLLSVGAFDGFTTTRNATNVNVDVTRIASYVAAGIGFLGGGAILKYGGKVTGVTTAASIWSGAAIGLASGLGFWSGAVAATVIALVALRILQPVGDAVTRLGRRRNTDVVVRLDVDADPGPVVSAIRAAVGDRVRNIHYGIGPGESAEIVATRWSSSADDVSRLGELLRSVDGVRTVEVTSS